MSTFDPNRFRVTDNNPLPNKQPHISEKKVVRNTQSYKFLKGPVPLPWLIAAAELPGKTFIVGIVIWFRCGLCKSSTITLPSTVLSLFHIDRSAKSRALDSLEKASLITVERRSGKSPVVTVLDMQARK